MKKYKVMDTKGNICNMIDDYIVSEIKRRRYEQPRSKIASDLGITRKTLYRYLHIIGAVEVCNKQFERLTDEQIEYIKAHYSDMSNKELSDYLGITKDEVDKLAYQLGLVKSNKHLKRIHTFRSRTYTRNMEVRRRQSETYKEHRERDLLRVKYGLKPKFHRNIIDRVPLRVVNAKDYLCRAYGYIKDKQDRYTLLYTENTRRLENVEQNSYNKYHIKFKEYDSCREDNTSQD